MNELPAFRITENGQAVFNWQELDRRWNDRLFFAILLESTIAVPLARRAAVWRRESGLRGQAFPAERLHISLVGLGDYDGLPEELVEIARHVASMVQAKPFEVSFDRLSAFGGGALVLRGSDGVPPLQAFWRNLTALIADSPLKPFVGSSFEAHVTLLRDKLRVQRVRERAIEPINWTVRDFVLIRSLIRQGRYDELGRWRLNGHDDSVAAM
ncbi:2'-5' RNA ligase family protein [Mesorhizobium sp. M1136]|uniref:2'-5' RNA ligase family protein n=1 Tax=Mesorhizobium sp. M1136 TaxID=2957059 RepID=UPI0033353927